MIDLMCNFFVVSSGKPARARAIESCLRAEHDNVQCLCGLYGGPPQARAGADRDIVARVNLFGGLRRRDENLLCRLRRKSLQRFSEEHRLPAVRLGSLRDLCGIAAAFIVYVRGKLRELQASGLCSPEEKSAAMARLPSELKYIRAELSRLCTRPVEHAIGLAAREHDLRLRLWWPPLLLFDLVISQTEFCTQ